MALKLDAKIPAGALADKWSNHKAAIKVVSPANKRKLDIIVVGTGLGGASAAASLGELGYNVKVFCIQDSPRRAHSIAAQGGINAAKNYQNDNDSVYRLFYDTIKGGDYRAREANVYRLAEVSNLIIDQCVGQGVPFGFPAVPALADDRPIRIRDDAAHGHVALLPGLGSQLQRPPHIVLMIHGYSLLFPAGRAFFHTPARNCGTFSQSASP